MQQNLVDSSKPHEIQTVVIEINEGGVDFSEIGRNNKVRLLNEINRYSFNQFELNVNNKLACVDGWYDREGIRHNVFDTHKSRNSILRNRERGDVVLADAGMVFIHELSGHCLPMIRNVQANAVEIENVIRSEIKFGVPLRKGNPHDSSI